jgi:2-polyprenyl-6-methoxyphenol hydroxylase-like FAD-dependent oxidoreductase
MSSLIGRRAVIIGAGIGGLSAAGALAPCFEQIIILERDQLTPAAEARSGIPQGRHSHGLLAGGLEALEELFPGYKSALVEAGAVPVEIARDLRYERADVGALPQRDFGLTLLCASRPLIELILRHRVDAIANVECWPECRVAEVCSVAPQAAARTVRFDKKSGESKSLDADLVVDASGRGLPTTALLDGLGHERPEVTEIGVDASYSTAVVEIPEPRTQNWKVVLTQPDPPRLAAYGVLMSIERDRWMVTICRRGPAERLDGWRQFITAFGGLITPTIYNALRHARPVEGIRHHAFQTSCWRHFERLPHLPRGVLPIADALCRFNPICGQGMSSAARQARLLRAVLKRSAALPDPIAALQAGFMAEVASIIEAPWTMSTTCDLIFPDTRGVRPENLEATVKSEAALFRAAVSDPVVHKAMIEVGHLLQPPLMLRAPHIVQRIEEVNAAA